MLDLIRRGATHRITGTTARNDVSSRSHAVAMLTVEEVTESARACSYGGTENVPILVVNVLAINFWLLTVPSPLYVVSRSVLYARCSVTKCIIYPISVLF